MYKLLSEEIKTEIKEKKKLWKAYLSSRLADTYQEHKDQRKLKI